MDIKSWFEKGTGLNIKENRHLKMPQLPYNVFIDDTYVRGADKKNNIIEHNLTIEHYSENIDLIEEKKIEDFLDKEEIKYKKSREWLDNEEMWMTIFELDTFLEKRKEGK